MFDEVCVVGAWAIHEFVKWSGRPCWDCLPMRSAAATNTVLSGRRRSFLFFLTLCVEGPLSWSVCLALPLSWPPLKIAPTAGGMVSGDVEQVTGGMGIQAAKLVD